MDIVKTAPKKIFKVNLVSADTTSWSGSLYNASYIVNMKNIIRDVADYGKKYKMTFMFKGAEDAGIYDDAIYGIHIDMGKVIPVYQYTTTNRLYSGILYSNAYISRGTKFFDTKPDDNDPVFYTNIENIENISIRVMTITTNVLYVPSTAGAVPKDYYIQIGFEEA